MLNWIKKQSVAAWIILGAAMLTVVAMAIYINNSTTGVMQTTPMNALPIVFSVISILLLAGIFASEGKVSHWIVTLAMLVVVVFLAVSLCVLIDARKDVAGNQWFIPGLATDDQAACLSGAITCAVFYVLSIVAVIAASVIGKFDKKAA